MAGIYIHIPFCKTRCIYCDFFTQTDASLKRGVVDALCKELSLQKELLDNEKINTVYFGGGTPSLLSESDFKQLFETIEKNYEILPDAEITIEANPDDLSNHYIGMLRALPFNRISIGIQSLNNSDLKRLCRRHSAQQAINVVVNCQKAGFINISVDLMYGLPNQTLKSWSSTLDKAISLNVQHISAYHLIYEDGTELHQLLQKKLIEQANENISSEMFSVLKEKLAQAGFIHYEISNFGKNEYFSRHNSSYWFGEKYLGIGPSAHSYNGISRTWNIASIEEYIESINAGEIPAEKEILDESMQYNDFVLTGMRTMWGINLEKLESLFGTKMLDYCLQNALKHLEKGYIIRRNNYLTISDKGLLISDGIMSDLMYIK